MTDLLVLSLTLAAATCAYGSSLLARRRITREIATLRRGLVALIRRETLPSGMSYRTEELRALWHTLVATASQRVHTSSTQEAYGELISLGSRLSGAADRTDDVARELVTLVLKRVRPEAQAAAVLLRDLNGTSRVVHLSGVPRGRIDELLLIRFDEALDGKSARGAEHGWGFRLLERKSWDDLSIFNIGATLLVPLRNSSGICGALWIGLSANLPGLAPERKFFIEALAEHAAASFHAAQKSFEETLKQSRERDFLLGISHDLRAPGQSALYALTDLMSGEAGELSPEQHLRISIAERALRDQLDILGDVLDFTKHQHGVLKPRTCRVRPQTVLREVIESYALEASQKRLQLGCDPFPHCAVLVDPHHLRRMITNLITNAIKYTDVGVVRVSFCRSDSMLEIRVTDTGIGVPEHERNQLFRQFERLSNGNGRSGFGLGLALTKALVELNGGYIFHTPNIPQGSIFGIGLPLAEGTDHNGIADGITPEERLGAIVVVDDDAAARRTSVRQLQGVAERILPASSPEEALELVAEFHPDVLVTDLHLGQESCETLLEGMSHRGLTIPTVVLTGSADSRMLRHLEERFGIDVIQKPVTRASLQLAVSQISRTSSPT